MPNNIYPPSSDGGGPPDVSTATGTLATGNGGTGLDILEDGSVLTTNYGGSNKRLVFSGLSDNNVLIPKQTWNAVRGDGTWEMKIYPTANPGTTQTIWNKGDGPACFQLNIVSGMHFQWAQTVSSSFTGNYASTTAALALSTWTHIAATKSGTTLKLYINGVLDTTFTLGGATADNPFVHMFLGTNNAGAQKFSGSMAEIREWDTVRTDAEILANKDKWINPATTGLVAYYRTSDTVPTLTDSTSHGNNGITQAGVSFSSTNLPFDASVIYEFESKEDFVMAGADSKITKTTAIASITTPPLFDDSATVTLDGSSSIVGLGRAGAQTCNLPAISVVGSGFELTVITDKIQGTTSTLVPNGTDHIVVGESNIAGSWAFASGGKGQTVTLVSDYNLLSGYGVWRVTSRIAPLSDLGAAASGANSDITSLTGLTSPVPRAALSNSIHYQNGGSYSIGTLDNPIYAYNGATLSLPAGATQGGPYTIYTGNGSAVTLNVPGGTTLYFANDGTGTPLSSTSLAVLSVYTITWNNSNSWLINKVGSAASGANTDITSLAGGGRCNVYVAGDDTLLHAYGGALVGQVTHTTNQTVTNNYPCLQEFDTTGGSLTATVGVGGGENQMYCIKKTVAANTLTVHPSSTIEGSASDIVMKQAGETLWLYKSVVSSEYKVIAHYSPDGSVHGFQTITFAGGGGSYGTLTALDAPTVTQFDCAAAGAGNPCYDSLPANPNLVPGKVYFIHRIDAVTSVPCQIRTQNAFQFDGGGPSTLYIAPGETVCIYSDGTNWKTFGGDTITYSDTSNDKTITAAGTLTIPHYLNHPPKLVTYQLVNQTGELGYTAGQVVAIGGDQNASIIAVTNGGFSAVLDATNMVIRFGSDASTFVIPHATTGVATAITNANWKIRFFPM